MSACRHWPDLLAFFFPKERKKYCVVAIELATSNSPRTVAFNGSNLPVLFSKRKRTSARMSFFFWRYWPDLNWRITVLQTGALPLGYSTIWKSGTRGYVPDLWSGRRGSNSLPPPWQGGALPDELRPQIWCLRSESNQRHADFQSAALPTELQRHMRKGTSSFAQICDFMATPNGLEPSTSSVTGWRANRLHHRAMFWWDQQGSNL